jgi:two-component system, OmpR family, sensor kinase
MRLINITTRYYIILFLLVLSFWPVVFYFIMKNEVYQSIDEILYNRANNIRHHIQQNPAGVSNYPLSDYSIKVLTKAEYISSPNQVFADTLVYEPTDDEFDEYRKLEANFQVDNRYIKITVVKPRLESTEIFNTIGFTLVPLSAVMILILTVSARLLNKKLWKPFYQSLDFLSNYSVDRQVRLPAEKHSIEEFKRLDESLQLLTKRNAQIFQEQKQFIENASHETQTPLAVIQSQLEILLQTSDLSGQQAEIIHSALKETDRLSKLNKTLLLLSKIENQQFIAKSKVNLEILTKRLLGYFEEKREKLDLTIDIKSNGVPIIEANMILAEVLVGNLLKNAFTHNYPAGQIQVTIGDKAIQIINTGPEIPDKTRIFQRFHNRSLSTDNWGLGLSIVKRIVDINGWKILYDFRDNYHTFRVDF